jgi:site-specific DNA-methyltransferase (adenine-specific)
VAWQVVRVDDSFRELAQLGDSVVDVALTDPPYNEHVQANMSSGTAMRRHVESGGTSGIPRVTLPFEALTSYEFAADLVRVAKRWAISFCAVEDFGLYRAVVGEGWVRGGIWYKPNSMGQLTGDRPAAAYEGLAIMHRKGKKRWNGRGSFAHWTCNGTRGEKGRHPNQKPLDLCLELVAKFTERGETVLDPFVGSGRIGEACVLLGRNYIGLERDAEWVEKASARLEAAEVAEGRRDEDCLALCKGKKAA